MIGAIFSFLLAGVLIAGFIYIFYAVIKKAIVDALVECDRLKR